MQLTFIDVFFENRRRNSRDATGAKAPARQELRKHQNYKIKNIYLKDTFSK